MPWRTRGREQEAIDDFNVAVRLRPDDAHLREVRAESCIHRASELATISGLPREAERAVALARRAVELAPNQAKYLYTLGVVQYRARQCAQAIATLEQSLAVDRSGLLNVFNLLFLAMAHHRQGQREQARACFHRADLWKEQHIGTIRQFAQEVAMFRTEAEAVLAGPAGELPADVFAPSR
jgi:tetratricopeptide (TPR) repeat protein